MDLIPALPPREVLEELDVAAGVLDALERLEVRFHIDLDADERPCVHASDRASGDAWKVAPTALLEYLAGGDGLLDESRNARR